MTLSEFSGVTLLIVDDDPDNLVVLSDAIAASGLDCKIVRAPNGSIAFDLVKKRSIDLIITDWDMPVMDGLDLLRCLKKDPATQDIPVIMCTGVMMESKNLQAALAAGAADYVRKPVDSIELTARVRSMLELSFRIRTITEQNQELESLNHQLVEKNEEIYQLAITDSLTEIFNRSYVMNGLAKEFSASIEFDRPLACIMIDVDKFKSINDSLGHQVGDRVLKQIAKCISDSIRLGDVVCRYGGEEFLVVLSNTTLEEAGIAAEMIRVAVESKVHERVTVSLGVADNRQGHPEVVDQMVRNADAALYRAKSAGRNRVVLYSEESNETNAAV